MSNTRNTKTHLLDQIGNAYTNLDECMRPYLKSLTPEQFEEDKNWWCTALEITGNQQSTFTIGQIVGNVISQVWDQIPALSRIKEWHKQAVDPSAACMEEAGHVAKYFMMVHPRQTFQYIDNNGGKKGKSPRYKMVGAVTEITLGSDINWDNQKHLAWRFGRTSFCGSCNNYKELFNQIGSLLAKIDSNTLLEAIKEHFDWNDYDPEDLFGQVCISSKEDHTTITDGFWTIDKALSVDPSFEAENYALLALNHYMSKDEQEEIYNMYDIEPTEIIPITNDKPGLYLYLQRNISNDSIINIIKALFKTYGLSYDDLKIQFI